MSSMQEYKEARVQYWEQMLGFRYNTNSIKFRAFTTCKALCNHVDAMKASAAYYNTDYQIANSKPLQSSTAKFFDQWASQLWPDHSKCPQWLDDNGADRLRFSQDTGDLKEYLWRFIETKCTSHFKHNPDKRGTLASELGFSARSEAYQQAPLGAHQFFQANTAKSPQNSVTTSADKTLTDIQLALYIDGNHELAGVIELTDVTTRDDLFDTIQQDLQDILGVGDRFDVVRFQRTDGEAFPRPNARSVLIKRFGQQDMWKAMVKTMLEHKIGDLEGFVIVKKGGVERR